MTNQTSDPVLSEDYEQTNVHDVYNKIASHFSATRYKPWPVIDEFLRSLRPGAVGLDVGCGNGKYLAVRRDVFIVASDRSSELAKFASQHEPHSTIVADILSLPHPPNKFDFAISIAVIHHLSTPQRRVAAIHAILATLKNTPRTDTDTDTNANAATDTESELVGGQGPGPGQGQALFFVWALEQKNSRRGWSEGDDQDQLVPWVLRADKDKDNNKDHKNKTRTRNEDRDSQDENNADNQNEKREDVTYHRYYHLYRRGELERDVVAAGGRVVRSGYDRDNWWCVAVREG